MKIGQTYCMTTSILRNYCARTRMYNDARHRAKPSTYVPNLPARVRITLYGNAIDSTLQIRFDVNGVYTNCISTSTI